MTRRLMMAVEYITIFILFEALMMVVEYILSTLYVGVARLKNATSRFLSSKG